MAEQDAFVIDHMGEAKGNAFQQGVQVKRHIVAGFLGLVQTVHVQQVVKQVYNVSAHNPDVVQVCVPAFLFPGIHGKFRTAAYYVQRGADVMGDCQDDILPHLQQRDVLLYRFLQVFPVFCLDFNIPLYNKVQNDQQDNGEYNQASNDKGRVFVGCFQTCFFVSEGSPCLFIQARNQHTQFPIDFLIT